MNFHSSVRLPKGNVIAAPTLAKKDPLACEGTWEASTWPCLRETLQHVTSAFKGDMLRQEHILQSSFLQIFMIFQNVQAFFG